MFGDAPPRSPVICPPPWMRLGERNAPAKLAIEESFPISISTSAHRVRRDGSRIKNAIVARTG